MICAGKVELGQIFVFHSSQISTSGAYSDHQGLVQCQETQRHLQCRYCTDEHSSVCHEVGRDGGLVFIVGLPYNDTLNKISKF